MTTIRITASGGNNRAWRDYWEREALARAFTELGYNVIGRKEWMPDIDILLFGHDSEKRFIEAGYAKKRFCWFISHPGRALKLDWSGWTYLWGCNTPFTDKLPGENKATILEGTMHKFKPRTEDPVYDVVMLGNGDEHRPQVIKHLIDHGFNLGLAGGLDGHVPPEYLEKAGFYQSWIENNTIIDFYNKGKVYVRIDMVGMRMNGMISQNPVEVIVNSETLMLHETNDGLSEISPSVPTFEYWDIDLIPQIEKYLGWSQEERDALATKCRREAEHLTSMRTAKEMEKYF